MKTLKAYIKECGSMEKAAAGLGVSYSTIFRIVHNKFRPSAMFVKLAKLAGVKL